MLPDQTPPPRRPIRWWPVWIILCLAIIAEIWVQSFYGRQRQDKNIATANVVIIGGFLLLLWCLFFSRLRWAIRLSVFGAIVAVVALMPVLFRIHGVTGDLVPILEWRWKQRTLASLHQARKPGSILARPPGSALTNDYPQFLGPHRNGILDQPRLARDWNQNPPARLWSHQVGTAWSGFAISGNHAITQEQRNEEEAIICYDLVSGDLIWSYAYPAHYASSLAGEGPRATPTISGQKVYALGSTGMLNCLDLETGKLVWSKDVVQDNQSHVNEWGMSGSPLVTDELVVVSAGGPNERSLVAYKAADGQFVWGGGDNGAGYSSPYLTTLVGVRQILIFNGGGVAAHALADGKILWKYPWQGGHPHVSTPIVLPEDRVLISSGYGVGSELVKIKKDSEGNSPLHGSGNPTGSNQNSRTCFIAMDSFTVWMTVSWFAWTRPRASSNGKKAAMATARKFSLATCCW